MKVSEYSGGVKINFDGSSVLIDPEDRFDGAKSVIISHAHSDHCRMLSFETEAKAYLTPQSFAIAQARMRRVKPEVCLKSYEETFEFGGGSFKFNPSGHILGSSQVSINLEKRIVYTGDFKVRDSLTQKGCSPIPCDVLVMESVYAHPKYVFPEVEVLGEEITKWINKTLEDDFIPILTGNPLGQGQELTKMLSNSFDVKVHPSIYRLNRVYEEFNVKLGEYEASSQPLQGSVFIAPAWSLRKIERSKCKIAVCTGWAVDERIKYFYGVDEAFPMSNHADFNERVEYIEKSKPELVITCHRYFYEEFALWVRQNLGIKAEPIIMEGQMKLLEF
ncbi:MAG: MBL fold metallo-hydrolase [Candidatus Bathyarchaeia archaeon]